MSLYPYNMAAGNATFILCLSRYELSVLVTRIKTTGEFPV